jgi:hypothetical protein
LWELENFFNIQIWLRIKGISIDKQEFKGWRCVLTKDFSEQLKKAIDDIEIKAPSGGHGIFTHFLI